MKINGRIRTLHADAKARFDRLAIEVRDLLKPKLEERNWFFTARVKSLDSFAMKLETGRVPDPMSLEDFYACTIVVPTLSRIEEAEQLVTGFFDLKERRPKSDDRTHKKPSAFDFDDLRLYVTRRALVSGRGADLTGTVFEIQIKTVLQYAWGIATHDEIYKTDTVSWSKERIAFQVKAMLEHAEISIAEADRLSGSPSIAKKDRKTDSILNIINQVERFWPKDAWPDDRKRLAENLLTLLDIAGLKADQLHEILQAEKRRYGLIPVNLSPYAFTLQALAQASSIDFEKKFMRHYLEDRILIHREMELPDWMWRDHTRIVRIES